MNRRTLFCRIGAAISAAVVAPFVAKAWRGVYIPSAKQVRWHADPYTPVSTYYFLNQDGPFRITRKGVEPLYEDIVNGLR